MGAPQSYSVTRRPPDVEDYIDMLRRYRSWIIGPMFAGLVIAVVVAFLWPDTYISSAVMRITPQQVSERLLPSVVNTQMTQRLNLMQQEILSRSSLADLIQRPALDLYKKERQRYPMEDIVQDMKNKYIKIQTVEMQTSQGGPRIASAFTISFSYPDRYKAQAVVRELVTKFTEQNVTVQKNQASLTASFLGDELKAAKDKMDSLESAIAKFKIENQGRLPEQAQANAQMLVSLQMQLANVNEAARALEQQRMMLETNLQTQISSQNYYSSSTEETVTGQAVRNERLNNLNQRIMDLKSTLAAAREMWRDDHPNIKRYQASLAVLERERDAAEKQDLEQQAATTPVPRKVANPQAQKMLQDLQGTIAGLKIQIQVANLSIDEKVKQAADLNKQIALYQQRIESSPLKEQEYTALIRDYSLAKQGYEDMSKRRDASETAQSLEEHKAGENLEVLDPASLPEQPAEPNRLAIAGIGAGMGLMFGIVLAGAKEMKNTSLKNLKDVRAYTNLPVLSSIPLLENALLVRRKRRLLWLAWSSAIIIGTIAMSGSAYYYYFGHA